MRLKLFTALLVAGLVLVSFAVGNYAKSESAKVKWEYTIVKHSPYLKETGSDFKKFTTMGAEGWELASSYPIKGEIIVSIFKRRQ